MNDFSHIKTAKEMIKLLIETNKKSKELIKNEYACSPINMKDKLEGRLNQLEIDFFVMKFIDENLSE